MSVPLGSRLDVECGFVARCATPADIALTWLGAHDDAPERPLYYCTYHYGSIVAFCESYQPQPLSLYREYAVIRITRHSLVGFAVVAAVLHAIIRNSNKGGRQHHGSNT